MYWYVMVNAEVNVFTEGVVYIVTPEYPFENAKPWVVVSPWLDEQEAEYQSDTGYWFHHSSFARYRQSLRRQGR